MLGAAVDELFVDVSIEKAVFNYYLTNGSDGIIDLREDLFTDVSIKRIHRDIKCLFSRGPIEINSEVLTIYLTESKCSSEDIIEYIQAYCCLASMAPYPKSNHAFMMDQLEKLRVRRFAYSLGGSIKSGLQEGKSADLVNDLMDKILIDKANGSGKIKAKKCFIYENAEERWKNYLHVEKNGFKVSGISTGISSLDDAVGGIEKGFVTCFFSKTAGGKTKTMMSIGYNIAWEGHTVMYISYEMPMHMIQKCFDSRSAMADFGQLRKGELPQEDRRRLKASLEGQVRRQIPFFIVDALPGTPLDVDMEINDFSRVYGKPPDVIVIDYAGLMMPATKFANMSDRYNLVFDALHKTAKEFNVAIITAVQESRSSTADKDGGIGVQFVGMSNYIAPHCEIMIQIKQNDQDYLAKRLKMYIVKSRYSSANRMLTLFAFMEMSYVGEVEIKQSDKAMRAAP